MSFTKEQRNNIKHYMIEKISENDHGLVSKTCSAFDISRNTVYRYLKELENDHLIEKAGRFYLPVRKVFNYDIDVPELSPEDDDKLYRQKIGPLLNGLPNNVQHIWYYCFTEMMNNIIDHSEASCALITVIQDAINTTVILADNGIGIFNKIRSYYAYPSLDDAIIELFKGKLTTDKIHHSGEGIFFASRIMDFFAVVSDGKVFTHTDYEEALADLKSDHVLPEKEKTGTTVYMKLSNMTKKTTKEIMDRYSNDEGEFIRTMIPIKNMYPTYPVSRSQAKRLTHRFDSFSEIELDFAGVDEIGQGFAHELFVVYANMHPEVKLIPFNAGLDVQKMIRHVISSNK